MAEEVKLLQPLQYLQEFLKQDIRSDGRKFTEFRSTLLNCDGVSSADGSALVKFGKTALICGVKAELIEPKPENPDKGLITISIELPDFCSTKYCSGIQNSDALVLTQLVQRVIDQSQVIDLKTLSVIEGKFVWNLNVEVICLNYDGNIIDCSLIAILAALQSCSLPYIETDETNEIIYKEDRIPLIISNYPIGSSFVIIDGITLSDPSLEEETLSESVINLVVNPDNDDIYLMHKNGSNKITVSEIESCLAIAKTRSKQLKKLILDTFNSTKNVKNKSQLL